MKLNRKLKARIIEHFGSQFAFAQALGVHEAYISKIVHRWRTLNREEQARWAELLKVNPEEDFFSNAE